MKQISFKEGASQDLIEKVAVLAAEIWREHYAPIIGKAQVDYILCSHCLNCEQK